ncbi:MAG: hypothetical protein ACE148_14720 [Vicinamibacterales bacterium]
MSLVRLLGFVTLSCGCVVGRYRDVGSSREIRYIEEKGEACETSGHRRNHILVPERLSTHFAAPQESFSTMR